MRLPITFSKVDLLIERLKNFRIKPVLKKKKSAEINVFIHTVVLKSKRILNHLDL